MSQLAKKLPTPETIVTTRVRRGPTGLCDIYGDGDLDDWRAVERLRHGPECFWATAHREVDKLLGITSPIDPDKFRYHWNGRCWHWTPEQKQIIQRERAQSARK